MIGSGACTNSHPLLWWFELVLKDEPPTAKLKLTHVLLCPLIHPSTHSYHYLCTQLIMEELLLIMLFD